MIHDVFNVNYNNVLINAVHSKIHHNIVYQFYDIDSFIFKCDKIKKLVKLLDNMANIYNKIQKQYIYEYYAKSNEIHTDVSGIELIIKLSSVYNVIDEKLNNNLNNKNNYKLIDSFNKIIKYLEEIPFIDNKYLINDTLKNINSDNIILNKKTTIKLDDFNDTIYYHLINYIIKKKYELSKDELDLICELKHDNFIDIFFKNELYNYIIEKIEFIKIKNFEKNTINIKTYIENEYKFKCDIYKEYKKKFTKNNKVYNKFIFKYLLALI